MADRADGAGWSGAGSAPEVCVGAVVVGTGRLLLVQRGTPPGAGRWSLPGGRVEAGETLAAAVRREVREETGLDVEPGELVGWVERFAEKRHFVILDFRAELSVVPTEEDSSHAHLPEPVAGDDARGAGWFELARVAELDLVDGLATFLREHGVIA